MASKYSKPKKDDEICDGTIKIGFPNSFGKCFDDTAKLCKKGELINESVISSLVDFLLCLVEYVLNSSPAEISRDTLCNVIRGAFAILPDSMTDIGDQYLSLGSCR
ncbi:uncharacterized protein LOC119400945 isoform X1 [Rhipicephalus sanguineus]|uniref:uncharacterized protein LOC119400945 isoform X1 n=1 Tax=Rhipicephalus sanguineus TaxID=34632 RepID=UPI0018950204|nr:uncharacterized protein LOC119400945 isoform X1 [Rhipicephalus sanguineus]